MALISGGYVYATAGTSLAPPGRGSRSTTPISAANAPAKAPDAAERHMIGPPQRLAQPVIEAMDDAEYFANHRSLWIATGWVI